MRNARPPRHSDYLELAYLEIDGELTQSETRMLDDHLEGCQECRAVREGMAPLHSVLDEIKIEAHADLARRVLENLPPAAWEMRRPGSWKVAAVAFTGLFAGAFALTFRGEAIGDALPWIGTLVAMAELFRSAALAGAGLLTASWSGVALALGQVLAESTFGLIAFGIFVLAIDALFLRYLWRLSRRRQAAAADSSRLRGRSG